MLRVERALARRAGRRGWRIGGGVAANALAARARWPGSGVELHVPPRELCTDNAAMIASAARWVAPAAGDADARPRRLRDGRARPVSGGEAVVTLYGRPGCHLCDDARAVLERLRAAGPAFALEEVDIEPDDALLRRYLERIPVVALDGEELYDFFVDEADLAARLRGGGGGPTAR